MAELREMARAKVVGVTRWLTRWDGVWFVAVILFSIVLLICRGHSPVLMLALISVGLAETLAVNTALKLYFKETRPDRPFTDGIQRYTMPSAHAQIAGTMLVMAFAVDPLMVVAGILILPPVMARIFAGLHSESEVVIGVLLGGCLVGPLAYSQVVAGGLILWAPLTVSLVAFGVMWNGATKRSERTRPE